VGAATRSFRAIVTLAVVFLARGTNAAVERPEYGAGSGMLKAKTTQMILAVVCAAVGAFLVTCRRSRVAFVIGA
jgi:hypothetical protein